MSVNKATPQPDLQAQFINGPLRFTQCAAYADQYCQNITNASAAYKAACNGLNALSRIRMQFGKTQRSV